MARKRKRSPRVPKRGPVWQRSAEQATLDRMPKFNGHACGTGAHGDIKYNRAKQKASWGARLDSEETRSRGSLPLSPLRLPVLRGIAMVALGLALSGGFNLYLLKS